MADAFEFGRPPARRPDDLRDRCGVFADELLALRDAFIARNEDNLVRGLDADELRRTERVAAPA